MISMRLTAPFRSLLLAGLFVAAPAYTQISLSTAVDLAVRNDPHVRLALNDLQKAQAGLAESRDAYVPSVTAGADIGYAYGFPLGLPTLFNFSAQSLVFNFQQRDYIRSSQAGVDAANLSLTEAKQQVAVDAALTYLALDSAERRRAVMTEQYGYANGLVGIVQDRLNAGQDSKIELYQAQLRAAQIHLQMLQMESEITTQRQHLARLIGLPATDLSTSTHTIPPIDLPEPTVAPAIPPAGVRAVYATARAKQLQAFGDSRFAWRPQVSFGANYSRFPTFNNYAQYYPGFSNNYNAFGLGVHVQVPLYDRTRSDRAHASAADAARAQSQAEIDRNEFLDGRFKLQQSAVVLVARQEVARLDHALAQAQLEALQEQIQNATGNGAAPLTPKDEKNAQIAERQKLLDMLSSEHSLEETEINLMRQNGDLETWLKNAVPLQVSPAVKP